MKTLGRNDPCTCKSGKKFKFCCLPIANKPKTIELNTQNTQIPQNNPNEILYELKCNPKEVFDALLPLSSSPTTTSWQEATFDPENNLSPLNLEWSQPNQTVLGNFQITQNRLKVIVNSEENGLKARIEIANRLSDKLIEISKPLDSINPTPDMLEMLENFIANHYKKWLDGKLVSLDGLTPREAAKTESGKEKLEALLLDFEISNSKLSEQEEYRKVDIDYLKRELYQT